MSDAVGKTVPGQVFEGVEGEFFFMAGHLDIGQFAVQEGSCHGDKDVFGIGTLEFVGGKGVATSKGNTVARDKGFERQHPWLRFVVQQYANFLWTDKG